MSSAALQAAPHQSSTVTALASHSPTAAPISSRPYTAGGQPSRDSYYSQQPANASPSSRRHSRRPSGNGASAPSNQQTQYYASNNNAPTASPITSRFSNHSSSTAAAAAAYPAMDRGPPVAPPRTSSNQKSSGVATAAAVMAAGRNSNSRRNDPGTYETASPQSRPSTRGEGQDRLERDYVNGSGSDKSRDDAAAAAVAATRTRRRTEQFQPEPTQYKPNNYRDSRSTSSPVISPAPRGSNAPISPTVASREAGEVLNRMVVSKPEVDLVREQERMAEAVPVSAGVEIQRAEEGTRRSRQDHSASGKREKNTKFGEYYLGNTLGEGEFGKVKMGWKQVGGVQV
jgi:protein-serine/threonine kinase